MASHAARQAYWSTDELPAAVGPAGQYVVFDVGSRDHALSGVTLYASPSDYSSGDEHLPQHAAPRWLQILSFDAVRREWDVITELGPINFKFGPVTSSACFLRVLRVLRFLPSCASCPGLPARPSLCPCLPLSTNQWVSYAALPPADHGV